MTGGDGRIWPLSARDLIAVQQHLGSAKPDTTAAMSADPVAHHLRPARAHRAPASIAARPQARAWTRSVPPSTPQGLGGVPRLPPTPAGDRLWAPTGAGAAAPAPPFERATGGKSMSDLHDDVFAISPDIRYVAAAHGQQVQMRSRPDLHNASSSDSDLYEELLVNPTLLTLATQRGNIDCGGLRYLIVGYGHFHQLVIPSPAGHVSIAFELHANPADHLQAILGVMAHHGQPAV